MKLHKTFFSVLIVVFNESLEIIERNIKNNSFKSVEYIIINNSTDDEYKSKLINWYEKNLNSGEKGRVKIIEADYNGGYTRGNNLGFSYSNGKYLLIINPDVEIGNKFLSNAYKIIRKHSWCLFYPKQVNNFKENRIRTGLILSEFHSLLDYVKIVDFNKINDSVIPGYYEAFYCQGGCFFIKRSLFKKLRGFDENFFIYSEEADLCCRAKKKFNITSIYCPNLIAAHYHDVYSFSIFSERLMVRNRLAFIAKNFPMKLFLIQSLLSIPRVFIKLIDYKNKKVRYTFIFPLFNSLFKGFLMGCQYLLNEHLRNC